MNSIDDPVFSLTPEMADDLKRAIELGKFPLTVVLCPISRES